MSRQSVCFCAVSMCCGSHMVFIHQHLCPLAHPWGSREERGLFATSWSILGSHRNNIVPSRAGKCLTGKKSINEGLKAL